MEFPTDLEQLIFRFGSAKDVHAYLMSGVSADIKTRSSHSFTVGPNQFHDGVAFEMFFQENIEFGCKLFVELQYNLISGRTERFRVSVKGVQGETVTGIIDDNPVLSPFKLHEKIEFKSENIFDFMILLPQ